MINDLNLNFRKMCIYLYTLHSDYFNKIEKIWYGLLKIVRLVSVVCHISAFVINIISVYLIAYHTTTRIYTVAKF